MSSKQASMTSTAALWFGAAALSAGYLYLGNRNARKWSPPKVWEQSEIRTTHGRNLCTAGAQQEKELPVGKHNIQLHSLGTPNGVKVTIMLEEIIESGAYPDFDYDAFFRALDGPQFDSGFVEINPNSKIPALVDRTDPDAPIRVFESASILVYLANSFPEVGLLPTDKKTRAECMNWVFWSIGSAPYVGGGFGHFYAYASKNETAGYLEYPINRFAQESKRQLSVLNNLFSDGRRYVCGDQYTIADVAIWPWYGAIVLGRMYGSKEFLAVHEYTHLLRWAQDLEHDRAAVRRGRLVNRTWGVDRQANPLYAKLPCLKERHSTDDWNQPVDTK